MQNRNKNHPFFAQQDNGLPDELIDGILSRKHDLKLGMEALKHAVWADVDKLKTMLDKDPSLVLFRGTATHPCGRTCENITMLEYAKIVDDYKMEQLILPYFDQFSGGKEALEIQQIEAFRRLINR